MNLGVQVSLPDSQKFLQITETLTRIGEIIETDTLCQDVHLLHKQGKYYLLHWKELKSLNGEKIYIDDESIRRRDMICDLLAQWKLVEADKSSFDNNQPQTFVKVIGYAEKSKWRLCAMCKVGNNKKQ